MPTHHNENTTISFMPSRQKAGRLSSSDESKLRTIVRDQLLLKRSEPYMSAKIRVKPGAQAIGKTLVVYLLRADTYKADVVKLSLDAQDNVTSREENYTDDEDDGTAYETMDFTAFDFVCATPVPEIPTAKAAVEAVAAVAQAMGLRTRILLGADASVANYKGFLSAGCLKGFLNVGHGNTSSIIVNDGAITATWFQSLTACQVFPDVVYFNSCQTFNPPLQPAIMTAGARTFIGGKVNLLIGPSEEVAKAFWSQVLMESRPMGDALAKAEHDHYPTQGAHGISGDLGTFFAASLSGRMVVNSNADGRLEVFAIGRDNGVYHVWQSAPNSGWSAWDRLGTTNDKAKSLAVGRNADGRLEVFAIGLDNGVYHLWQTAPNNGWSAWGRLGATTDKAKSLAVGRNADGRLEVFAIGMDDGVYHLWQTAPNNGWSAWGRLGTTGDKAKELAMGNNADGRLEVFTVGLDNGVYHVWQTAPNNGWSAFARLGATGDVAKSLAVGRNADRRLEVFAVGMNEGIYHVWQTAPNNGWSAFARLGTTSNKAVLLSVGSNRDGRLELCTIGTNGNPYHFWQTAPNNGWSAEAPLSGAMPGTRAVAPNVIRIDELPRIPSDGVIPVREAPARRPV